MYYSYMAICLWCQGLTTVFQGQLCETLKLAVTRPLKIGAPTFGTALDLVSSIIQDVEGPRDARNRMVYASDQPFSVGKSMKIKEKTVEFR